MHIPKIKASGLVPEKDIALLFSNVEQLVTVNREFLRMLQERRKAAPLLEKIGDIFVKMVHSPVVSFRVAESGTHAVSLC